MQELRENMAQSRQAIAISYAMIVAIMVGFGAVSAFGDLLVAGICAAIGFVVTLFLIYFKDKKKKKKTQTILLPSEVAKDVYITNAHSTAITISEVDDSELEKVVEPLVSKQMPETIMHLSAGGGILLISALDVDENGELSLSRTVISRKASTGRKIPFKELLESMFGRQLWQQK